MFGDVDGVLAFPRAAEDEIVRLAIEKVSKENLVRKAILAFGRTKSIATNANVGIARAPENR